jgi:hypothetical protein
METAPSMKTTGFPTESAVLNLGMGLGSLIHLIFAALGTTTEPITLSSAMPDEL